MKNKLENNISEIDSKVYSMHEFLHKMNSSLEMLNSSLQVFSERTVNLTKQIDAVIEFRIKNT